jgi:TRAP-type mannitol/chloroaromatic compound transport system permease small subunit
MPCFVGDEAAMGFVRGYIRWVDRVNRVLGRIAMYLVFALIGILLWSSISKTFFLPSLWTLEMAQFTMVAYFILGGPYSIQLGSNVRMDLFYGEWSPRTQALVDAFVVFFLLYYLAVLLWGGLGSLAYSLGYFGMSPSEFYGNLISATLSGGISGASEVIGRLERSPTAWRPFLWPIKSVICIGIVMMILQASAEFFRDVARIRGEEL